MTQDYAPRCVWIDDKCEHGYAIDDRDVRWNPLTRTYTCALAERRAA